MSRAFLIAAAIVFTGFGLWGLVNPVDMVSRFGIILDDPDGRTLIRASYGGFLIGAGVLFGWSAMRRDRHNFGLVAVIALTLPILLSRAAGMAIEGAFSNYHTTYAAIEAVGITLAAVLLKRHAP